jgi:hypothetical protein
VARPAWWPARLWPSAARETSGDVGVPGLSLPERAPARAGGERARRAPAESFLRTLVEGLSSGRASIWVYHREGATWELECEVGATDWPRSERGAVSAGGHPFTWALREGLILQVPSEKLGSVGVEGGWTLLGVVPGSRRALTLEFAGSPPAGARRGLEAALAHLADLESAGYLTPV